MTNYYCKECGAKATVTKDGKIIRLCDHNVVVVADMKAETFGIGRTVKDAKQS